MNLRKMYMLFTALTLVVSSCSSGNETDPTPNNPGDNPGGTEIPGPGTGDEGGAGNPDEGHIGAALDGLLQDDWIENTPVRYSDTIVYGECTFIKSSGWDYAGGIIVVDLAPVYEAFLMTEEDFTAKFAEGTITFAAYEPDGNIEYTTTANGYGYWFDAFGYVTTHGTNSVIAAETEDFRTYNIAQYPGVAEEGHNYVVSLVLLYEVEDTTYKAVVQLTAKVMDQITAEDYNVAGTVVQEVNISKETGYDGEPFTLDGNAICNYLGISESDFSSRLGSSTFIVPMNANGTEGENTASGDYGAWFGMDGTTNWGNNDLTFIEIGRNAPFYCNTGCHDSHVSVDDVITMRLQYRDMNSLKACNVEVVATIVE